MSNLNLTVQQINELEPMEIATNDFVRAKFIQIYEAMWTPSLGISGEAAYERESRNFTRILAEKEDIREKSTKFSIFTAFLDVAISGLSLDPGSRAQAYIQGRNVAIGKDANGKTIYEGQAVLIISGYGELLHRARCGQIRHADNPVIVYAEDEFEFGERNGVKFVNYTCRLPHTSNKIVGAFMKITRADGSIDYAVLLEEGWQRLAVYSSKNNSKWDKEKRERVPGPANALYTSNGGTIDPGFLAAKCIKHAFTSYPKARVGRSTQLESQYADNPEITDDIYGVADTATVDTSTGEVINHPDTGFAPAPDTSAGVVINPETTSTDDVF